MKSANSRSRCTSGALALAMSTGLASSVQAQITTYVNAACGNDAWTGATQTCQAPDGPKSTIQAAITAASNGDTVLVAAGTYTEHISFLGKAIAVRAASGASPTISGGGTGLVVGFTSGESSASILEGFTITGGTPGPTLGGGGIKIQSASPTIRACTITGNVAGIAGSGSGGGILIVSGSPTIDGCIISNNRAEPAGGGVFIQGGSPLIVGCTMSQNQTSGSFSVGGGIAANLASPVIRNCTISANTAGAAGYGGGVSLANCQSVIDRCTITGNNVDQAGGLNCVGGSLVLTRCTIASNGAAGYGGLYFRGGASATGANCLIQNNSTAYYGASAVAVDASTCTFVNCTIANNRGFAYGIAAVDARTGAASLSNCILWGNYAQSTSAQALGATITSSDIQGGFAGAGNINADPLFANTTSGDFTLQSGSPCLDAGDNASYFASPGATFTDLLDKPRGVDVRGTAGTGSGLPPFIDMGAYESQGSAPCYPNCDNSTTPPILNVNDFVCFLNRFAVGCP